MNVALFDRAAARGDRGMGRNAILALVMVLAAEARADDVAPLPAAVTVRVGVPSAPDAVAGFDRSLFAEAAREAGYGVIFDVMPSPAALAGLDAGRVDVAAGPFPPEAARRRRALAAVAVDGDGLLKRRGDNSTGTVQAVSGKVVDLLGLPAGAAQLRADVAALGARVAARPKAFADPLRDLAAGRLAALVGPWFEAAAVALARPDSFEIVGPPFGRTVRLAPLMRADRPDLAARLDGAIARMTADGRVAALQRRWFGIAFDTAGRPAAPPKP